MYRKYYGLKSDPFRLSPDHAFCLPHRSFAKAKAYMRYAMHRNEGFVMITGAPGTGKTTLIDDLLAGTRASDFSIARLVSAQVEADDILRMVAAEFGIPAQKIDKSEILRLLSNQFTLNFKQRKRSLLIVDEAQGLAVSALEELRLLTNMRNGGQPLLQIFLVGQEELRDMVTSPELEQLNQRMIAAYHMEPLKPEEFVAYVLHRLTVAGWKGNPGFKPELFPELFRFSNGLPRRINHICSRLLLHGFLEEKRQLDAADMDIVIKELRAEHYAIKENTSLITQDKFNPEDLRRMARSALSEQSAVAADGKEGSTAVAAPGYQEMPDQAQQPAACDPVKPAETTPPDMACGNSEAQQSAGVFDVPGPAQQLVVPVVAKRSFHLRLPVIRFSTAAAVFTMSIGLSLLLLVSAPTQHLNKFAGHALWDDIGLTGIRTLVSNWSGGRLPLKGENGSGLKPLSPAVIERRDEEPGQASAKFNTAAESEESDRPAAQLKKEVLGEAAPVLSESGGQVVRLGFVAIQAK